MLHLVSAPGLTSLSRIRLIRYIGSRETCSIVSYGDSGQNLILSIESCQI